MSTTSTNKQPMLIDRPLLEAVTAGTAPCLTVSTNLQTPSPAGMSLLVVPGSDGCMIDSISVVVPQTSITAANLLVFMSTAAMPALISPFNTACVTLTPIASASMGQRTNVPLLPLSVPVPSLASPAATIDTWPGELDKKNTGILVPYGKYLYVGTDVALFSGAVSTEVTVIAQGGYY